MELQAAAHEQAETRIQAATQGYLARRSVKVQREATEDASAGRINAVVRGKQVRNDLEQELAGIALAQSRETISALRQQLDTMNSEQASLHKKVLSAPRADRAALR